ncbi:F-box protein [Quillaja saponaria]|uniref:F-box protein n=1 Tax=Quillaja saponaria TaxID=32244 RepID=A0AAD7QIU8_QUISA|nr:F-box protein [Quillaja saponaria]
MVRTVGFRSANGVVLNTVESVPKPLEEGDVSPANSDKCRVEEGNTGFGSNHNGEMTPKDLGKNEVIGRKRRAATERRGSGKRKSRSLGLVNGSISVVHQLHALENRKCLKIDARVLQVEVGGSGGHEEARAVLLVDVYLPIEVWCGWQFPKSGSVAGALFGHLSCDWSKRSSMLSSAVYCENTFGAKKSIWNLSACHVLGCKLHANVSDPSKKRFFELHEIFKSLPGVGKQEKCNSSRIEPMDGSCKCGIWEMSDDILINILATFGPKDLVRVAATCRHLRSLAVSIMPCLKLKLFPHQLAAVEWMLHRERTAEVLPHPLYAALSTEDGFSFYVNNVSGEIATGAAPTIKDFCGGMFCDEPGLGKTVTALSLVLKTQGTLTCPPDGAHVIWCQHNGDQRCGYYELNTNNASSSTNMSGKMDVSQDAGRNIEYYNYSSKRSRLLLFDEQITTLNDSCSGKGNKSPVAESSEPSKHAIRCTRTLSCIKSLSFTSEGEAKEGEVVGNSIKRKCASDVPLHVFSKNPIDISYEHGKSCKRSGKTTAERFEYNDTWVQCDACHKWRKLAETSIANASAAWFCSMNTDPLYQSCSVAEESWHHCSPITYLPGFHSKETSGGEEKNKLFFISVLKEHYALINYKTKKALTWLATISTQKLADMETIGLRSPFLSTCMESDVHIHAFHKIFQAFGLIKRVEKGVCRWYYPRNLCSLAFDVAALRIALREPLNSVRRYLSKATLIVVPSNLVDHWKTQIEKHVRAGQLRVYVWTDYRKPSAHCLAWDYDVVITTFSRLSAEWSPHKKSVLMQVHWLRVMLDEGHTLCSSVNLTNKLQMAISLTASNRWILTGTPTPNTPNSQLSHLQPLLKFLHEEAYGQNQKSWEAGILRPFEAEMEEGRSRLLHLLHKCMISARKLDLQTIPPCIKKVIFLNFTVEHARSYNELVLTVRRNILMADWNDPSHVESLLNPKQWKFRGATIKNVRLSCCVAGHIKVAHAGEDIQETMDILVENGLDPASAEYTSIKHNLLFGGNCIRCGEWCRLPVITPCQHLLCLDCVALDSTRCTYPGCGNLYEMQCPDTLTRAENPNPKWPVPKDLIELQPSYKQDNWDPDWQSTSSSKVAYLVQRLKALQEANREVGCNVDGDKDPKHSREAFPLADK